MLKRDFTNQGSMAARSTKMHLPGITENEDLVNDETKSTPGATARDTGALSEGEAAKKGSEEAPPVIDQDTEKFNSLTSEVKALKALLQSEREATQDLRKAISGTELRISELAAKLENVTRKVDQLQESVRRLEEKSSISERETPVLPKTLLPENQELLVKCISKNLGYSGGKPVAACVIYKCLLHWGSFELKESNIFHRIIQTIVSDIEVPDNNDILAYWLSNSAMLLCLLQHTFTSATIPASRVTSCNSMSELAHVLHIPLKRYMGGGLVSFSDTQSEVEVEYPALLFKQQLIVLLEKIYEMMRDNLKKEISSLLPAPRAGLVKGRAQANAVAWQSIRKILNTYLNLMKANNAPPFLVRKVFTQIFSFINLQMFNSFLLRRECCTSSNGENLEAGLAEIKRWCVEATDEFVDSAWDELRHIRQAAGFLKVIHQKQEMTLEEITRELCPVLNIQQIYRISTMYWDDKYGMPGVSSDLIAKMTIMMEADVSSNETTKSFMLDEDTSIPFTVEDISKSMQQVDVNDIEPPQLIRESPGFSFLVTREKGSSS